jgi:hypothetical protein
MKHMDESEKLQKWQETWQSHWKKKGPRLRADALRRGRQCGMGREFLAKIGRRKENNGWIDPTGVFHGFDRPTAWDPQTVFGSARFQKEAVLPLTIGANWRAALPSSREAVPA